MGPWAGGFVSNMFEHTHWPLYIKNMHILFQFWFDMLETALEIYPSPHEYRGPLGDLSAICLTIHIGRYIENIHIIFLLWFGMLQTALKNHPSPLEKHGPLQNCSAICLNIHSGRCIETIHIIF